MSLLNPLPRDARGPLSLQPDNTRYLRLICCYTNPLEGVASSLRIRSFQASAGSKRSVFVGRDYSEPDYFESGELESAPRAKNRSAATGRGYRQRLPPALRRPLQSRRSSCPSPPRIVCPPPTEPPSVLEDAPICPADDYLGSIGDHVAHLNPEAGKEVVGPCEHILERLQPVVGLGIVGVTI